MALGGAAGGGTDIVGGSALNIVCIANGRDNDHLMVRIIHQWNTEAYLPEISKIISSHGAKLFKIVLNIIGTRHFFNKILMSS